MVLFIFAIGVVKGFAFALGLSTVIDVFVVFFFTKPMVTLLSRTKFFGNGHKWSGLDREHLGLPPLRSEKPKPSSTAAGRRGGLMSEAQQARSAALLRRASRSTSSAGASAGT